MLGILAKSFSIASRTDQPVTPLRRATPAPQMKKGTPPAKAPARLILRPDVCTPKA